MQKYNTNTAFTDLLFNMLIGFTSLLLIAFLLINPIVKTTGIIKPPTKMLITAEWDKNSSIDIDLWARGPNRVTVNYVKKDGNYIVLERDDLGMKNDIYEINGVKKHILRNQETITVNDFPIGEYVINLHNYTSPNTILTMLPEEQAGYTDPTTVKVTIIRVDPYKIIYEGYVTLKFREEKTVVTFVVSPENELIKDIRTDIQIPLYYEKKLQ